VRIIGGTLKGRRFNAPKQIPARPTTDYAKESLFNILNNKLVWGETRFLDLFSGIGSISLEAISRGALHTISIDSNYAAIKWYQQLKKEFDLTAWHTIKQDAFKWLKQDNNEFDLVFADPPYDSEFYNELIETIIENKLSEDGIFVLEHRKSDSFSDHPHFESERNYGEVKFTFFTKEK
jgi:16S rRNA (guanine966-N2)-methyltransferase